MLLVLEVGGDRCRSCQSVAERVGEVTEGRGLAEVPSGRGGSGVCLRTGRLGVTFEDQSIG